LNVEVTEPIGEATFVVMIGVIAVEIEERMGGAAERDTVRKEAWIEGARRELGDRYNLHW